MKASDLRIGNWVDTPDGIKQVEQLEKIENKGDIGVSYTWGVSRAVTLCFSSIPITEEWLLKFGFKKDGGFNWIIAGHRIYVPTTNIFVCDKNGVVLKHVHQLQNLYHALTGKELTIK